MSEKTSFYKYCTLFFFLYFSLGAFLPLLSNYLKSMGFTGIQIGYLNSVASICSIIAVPFWGYISDITHKHKGILLGLLIISGTTGAIIPQFDTFAKLVVLFVVFNIGLSALFPLTDSIALHSNLPFGKIRLWGSVGFGVATATVGRIIAITSLEMIFYVFVMGIIITFLLLSNIKVHIDKTDPMKAKDFVFLITNKKYIVLVLYSLLMTATIAGNNSYFGLLYLELGGKESMIGIAFLLFTVSEAPFMQFVEGWIEKFGIYKLLTFSSILLAIRWFIYGLGPPTFIILVLFFLQGLTYGLFLISTAEYIRREFNPKIRTTAITLYNALTYGLGGMLINIMTGYIIDYTNVRTAFFIYGIISLLSILLISPLKRITSLRKAGV